MVTNDELVDTVKEMFIA